MLRMPPFDVVSPETVEGVVQALAQGDARLVAGGTDLLPNLKHWLETPARLVSLHRVASLRTISRDGDTLRLGAGVTLAALAADERVRAHFPSLAQAAGSVAGPQIRNTATLGGNLHLDTRCRWVNQTEFWRGALGGCLKSDGELCHVVEGGRRCVAALSSDCVPVLVSLGASLVLLGPGGRREVPLADHYQADGLRHTRLGDAEVAVEVRIPLPAGPRRTTYVKWRPRGAIDFPLVSLALRLDLERDLPDGVVTAVRAVAGALGSRPREVRVPEGVVGLRLGDPELARRICEAVHEQCKPLANVPYDPAYRRHMLRVLSRRAIEGLASPRTGVDG